MAGADRRSGDEPRTPRGEPTPPLGSTRLHVPWVAATLGEFLSDARRPVDDLLARLRREADGDWLASGLERRYGSDGARFEDVVIGGSATADDLRSLKQAAKDGFDTAPRSGDRSLAVAAYFLAIAAALAHHRELITSQGRETIDPELDALAGWLPERWAAMVRKALACRQGLPYLETEQVRCLEAAGVSGQRRLVEWVMRVYYRPLQIYYLGTSFRRLGPPEDLVGGFFAKRLARPDYIRKWLDRKERGAGPLRLSDWLRNGLLFYLREQASSGDGRESATGDGADVEAPPSPAPSSEYYAELAVRILEETVHRVEESSPSEVVSRGARALIRKYRDGVAIRDTARELGVEAATLRQNARRARPHLRRIFREALLDHGVRPDEIGDAIDVMLGDVRNTAGSGS